MWVADEAEEGGMGHIGHCWPTLGDVLEVRFHFVEVGRLLGHRRPGLTLGCWAVQLRRELSIGSAVASMPDLDAIMRYGLLWWTPFEKMHFLIWGKVANKL